MSGSMTIAGQNSKWRVKKGSLIWDVLAPEWAKLRGEGWLILWYFTQKIVSVSKMISRTRPEIRKQVYFRSVNNKRKVIFQASRGWNIGKLPSQRLRHKNGGRTGTQMLYKCPLDWELFKSLVFKMGGTAESTFWGHRDHLHVERRVSLQCDNV